MNPVAHEPVLTALLAAAIAWAAARYGMKVTPDQATVLAGIVAGVAAPYARQLVRPTAKDRPARDVPSSGEADEEPVVTGRF